MLHAFCGLFLQLYSAHVSAPVVRDDPSSVSVIELGLPGQPGAPSAAKVSLAEVLVGQPGVQLRSAAGLGQWSGALLRGADAGQVAIMLDGVPLQRASQSAVDLSQIPIDGAERIEIYRGVPPIDVGIDAIGGAINIISRRGRGLPTLWALLGSGSFGLRKVTVGHTGERDGLRVSATVSYQGASGDFPYLSNGGMPYSSPLVELLRKNDDFDQVAADVHLAGEARYGSYFLSAHGLLKEQGIPGIGQAQAQPGRPRLSLERALTSGGGLAHLFNSRLDLAIDGHALLERTHVEDAELQSPTNFEQLIEQLGARVVARVHERSRDSARPAPATLILLSELRYEHFTSDDLCAAPRHDCSRATPTASDRLRGLLGAGGELRFGDAAWPDRLLISPGVHVLLARSRLQPIAGLPTASADDAQASDEAFLAPRLSARLHVKKWLLLRAGGGRFVRLPTFLELFGDRAFYNANLTLRPESAWLFEAGGRIESPLIHRLAPSLSLEAHGFVRHIDDLIDTVHNGPILRAHNVGQAVMAGVELSGRAAWRERIAAQLNYTFLDAHDRTVEPGHTDKVLPIRPPHSVFMRVEVGYLLQRLGYELDYTSLLYLDAANLEPRPARALHALFIQSGPYGRARLTLAIELRNLADTRALPVALPLSGGVERPIPLADIHDYPLPGRSLYATLSARL